MRQLDLEKKSENMMMECLIPGLFTLILAGCLIHVLGMASMGQLACETARQQAYAISAFAN